MKPPSPAEASAQTSPAAPEGAEPGGWQEDAKRWTTGGSGHGRIAVNAPVFFISGGLLILFVGFGVLHTDAANRLFSAALDGVYVHTRLTTGGF